MRIAISSGLISAPLGFGDAVGDQGREVFAPFGFDLVALDRQGLQCSYGVGEAGAEILPPDASEQGQSGRASRRLFEQSLD